MTESAAWIEITRPWFLLQTYCEHRSVSIADYLVAEVWCDRMTEILTVALQKDTAIDHIKKIEDTG